MTSVSEIIDTSPVAFGTSGVRGLVTELSDRLCFAYTLAFLEHLKINLQIRPGRSVHFAHDLRPSSSRIARACQSAILHAGYEPAFWGAISTPALAHHAMNAGDAAIMITGSHIPFDRNGVKFYRPDGEMLKDDEPHVTSCQRELPGLLFDGDDLISPPSLPMQNTEASDTWMVRTVSAFDDLLTGMKIGHYQHSAAGRDELHEMLERLGANVTVLNRSETFVPLDTEAVSDTDLAQAQNWAKTHKFDAIVSTDGDGDRPLLGDETGHYFRGDTLGMLAAKALGASTVVTPVSSTSAIELSGWFETVHRTRIGSPYVIEALQKSDGKVVGFEANGGFLTATSLVSPWTQKTISSLPTRDAILPILATIALANQTGSALSSLRQMLPDRHTISDRLENSATDKSNALILDLQNNLPRAQALTVAGSEVLSVNTVDGFRITFDNGEIVHLRPSGNAPELRMYVEAASPDAAAKLLDHVREKAQSWLSS